MSEKVLVPGAKVRLTSKAGISYEGSVVSVDDEEGRIALAHVLSFGIADKKAQPSTVAQHFVYGYVVFRQSELKEIKVLDDANPWPSDPAIVKVVEDCTASRATKFSNKVLSWIERRENEKVQSILDNCHLHHSFDATEKTLLHYAVEYKNATIVEKLLAMGSNVDAQDSMGTTPLMMAMKQRRRDRRIGWTMVKIILAAGADILILNKEGKCAVHMFCASYEDFFCIGEEFFEKFAKKCPCSNDEVDILVNAGCTVYQIYQYLKDLRAIELMLQRGLPVNDLDSVYKESVLRSALRRQDVECIQLLLEYGADAEAEDSNGQTPLVSMYIGDDLPAEKEARIVQLLLKHGASPTTCTFESSFQARHLLANGIRGAIRVLLESNLDFTATDDEYHRYPLQFLAINSNPGVAEELNSYRKKINVNVRDDHGATPLHWAVKYENVEMVEFLLSMGADVDAVHTIRSVTPLYFTISKPNMFPKGKYKQCAELLLQHYADPQIVITTDNLERVTVFEAAFTAKKSNRMRLFVAQMAILERRGTAVAESVEAKINSKPKLKELLHGCRLLLGQEMSGSVTLLKLITAGKKEMARYLNNRELAAKLESDYVEELRLSSSFYAKTLVKRHSDGVRFRRLKGEAAVSITKIFQGTVDEKSLIVDRIIDFLDDESLECLKDSF